MEYSKHKHFDFYLFTGYHGDFIQDKVRLEGTYDPELTQWMMKNIKPGWIIYDIGANIFEYAMVAAHLSGSSGLVHAFEPQLELVKKYKIAKSLSPSKGAAKILVYPFGLSDTNAAVDFYISPNNFGGSTISEEFKNYSESIYSPNFYKEKIFVKRADSIGLPNTVPDLIKIDIEGAEGLFWNAAPDFLKKSPRIIAEVGSYTEESLVVEYLNNRTAFSLDDKVIGKSAKEIFLYLEKHPKNQCNIVFK
jgi:FkbM family methyltransferase